MTDTTIVTTRASDADRDQYADVLREHTASGELSVEQFTDRIDATYAATTLAELDRLVEDLPAARPHNTEAGRVPALVCTCVRRVPVSCALVTLIVVLIALLG